MTTAALLPTKTPAQIGPYRVLRRLTDGGMGRLLLARDPALARRVVLKMLRTPWSGDEAAVARLRREARILARIDHDGVLKILDVLDLEGSTVLVLPHVQGHSLQELLDAAREGRDLQAGLDLNDPKAVLLSMERIARAVLEVHGHQVIHRDLKPGNVMIRPSGRPVVLDFGLATSPDAAAAKLTLAGQRVGTPPYMAPEQIRGEESRIGPATDVYALCTLLFELSTLRRAFAGDTLQEVYDRVLAGDWTRDLLPDASSKDLRAVLEKGLHPDPESRYPDAAALAGDLRRLREGLRPSARSRGWFARWLRVGR